jgi:hypothetical protein
MTLFDAVSTRPIFNDAIEAFYAEGKDPATLLILKTDLSLSAAEPRLLRFVLPQM